MDSGGQGANALGEGFLEAFLGIQKNKRANAEEKRNAANDIIINQLRRQQFEQAQQAEQQNAAVMAGQMNLRGNVNMPGLIQLGIVDPQTQSSDPRALKQVAQGQVPQGYQGMLSEPTIDQRVNQYMQDAPIAGLPLGVQLGKVDEQLQAKREQYKQADELKRYGIEQTNERAKADRASREQMRTDQIASNKFIAGLVHSGNSEKAKDAQLQKQLNNLDTYGRLSFENPIAKFTIEKSNLIKNGAKEDDKNVIRLDKQIAEHTAQFNTLKDTRARVANGELDYKTLKWQKNQSPNSTVKTSTPPKGFTDTGKTSGGKKVYTDGAGNAWLE